MNFWPEVLTKPVTVGVDAGAVDDGAEDVGADGVAVDEGTGAEVLLATPGKHSVEEGKSADIWSIKQEMTYGNSRDFGPCRQFRKRRSLHQSN